MLLMYLLRISANKFSFIDFLEKKCRKLEASELRSSSALLKRINYTLRVSATLFFSIFLFFFRDEILFLQRYNIVSTRQDEIIISS